MKILHYTLGLPPYRTGGLTKYATDLMVNQSKFHQVYLLFPGTIGLINKNVNIKSNYKYNNIFVDEIINPLPVTLLGGVKDIDRITGKTDDNIFRNYLNRVKPDVIHLHTLMGLHKEFLDVAKSMNIKIVYTSHDYFGICPKVNLLDYNKSICTDYVDGERCIKCNQNAYSNAMIFLMQSKVYRKLKTSKTVSYLRERKKSKINEVNETYDNKVPVSEVKAVEYRTLRKYYINLLKMVDEFHFNSKVAEQVYRHYIPELKGRIIPITHSDIRDNRKFRSFSSMGEELRLTYLGPVDSYKGFYFLLEGLEKFTDNTNLPWHLNVYGNSEKGKVEYSKYVTLNGRYNYHELNKIFNKTDLLIIPSIWKETFGFIGLEALTYGIPILISDNVGLQDIVSENKVGIVFESDIQSLCNSILTVLNNRDILKDFNKNIMKTPFFFSMDEHTDKIIDFYRRVLGD